jgi:hypothetical protein
MHVISSKEHHNYTASCSLQPLPSTSCVPVIPLELLAIKKIPKRPLAPATENSYVEVGFLLATGYGKPKFSTNFQMLWGRVIAKRLAIKKLWDLRHFECISLYLSLSLYVLLSSFLFCFPFFCFAFFIFCFRPFTWSKVHNSEENHAQSGN